MVKGVQALRRRMAKVPKNIRREVARATEQGASEVATFTVRLAPEQYGGLKRSIKVKPIGAGGSKTGKAFGKEFGKFGHAVQYGDATTVVGGRSRSFQLAKLQEFGTQGMPANPALFPAFRALRTKNKGRITRAINRAVKNS